MDVPKLRILSIDITGKCNCSCIHCGQEFKLSELGREEIREIVKEAKLLGLTDVIISGGEPFYHPDIFGILEDLYEEKVYISILTNGTLIEEKDVSFISNLPNLTYLRISIESINPGKLDAIRNTRDCFSKIIRALSLLRKHRIPFGTSMTVGSHNFKETSEFIEFSVLEKANFIRLSPLIRRNDDVTNLDNGIFHYFSEVKPADIAFELACSIANYSDNFYTGFLPVSETREAFSSNFGFPCPAGRFMMTVTSDRHATFCPFSFPDVAINLEPQLLPVAWKQLIAERNRIVSRDEENIDIYRNGFCLIKNAVDPEDFNPLKISGSLYEKINKSNSQALRKVLSGIAFRQNELSSLNVHPCWRSSPLFLIPLHY